MGRMYKTAKPKGSQLVAMADDPYDFENDDYEESSTPNFEPFFYARTDEEQATRIFGESDDEEFTGFIEAEQVPRKPEHSRVARSHHREDEERYT